MALSATAITTLARAKQYLRLDNADARLHVPAIDLYWDTDAGADTTATVEVEADTLVLATSAATGDESTDLTNANYDTLTELVARINAITGWEAQLLYFDGTAASTDLVDQAAVSAYGVANRKTLKIVDNLGLERLIEQVTDEIEKWLGRGVVSTTYTDIYHYQRNGGIYEFQLGQSDVTAVTRLATNSVEGFTANYGGADTHARIEVTSTGVTFVSRAGGTTTSNTVTFADQPLISGLVGAAPANWTCTTVTDGPSAYLVREGVRDARGRTVSIYAWDDYDGDYIVDYEAGTIALENLWWPYSLRSQPTHQRRIAVDYTAGFATVPDDVDAVALEMIADAYANAGRDRTIASESLGDYSYSVQPLTAVTAGTKSWERRLEKYKRWTP